MKDGQEAGEMLLDIEGRIGELLPPPEEALKTMKGPAFTSKERGKRLEGITVHRASNARAISHHPDIVEKVKAQARENERKIENLLFVIWIQDQRHDYWMKFIKEVREAIQKLREEIEDGDTGMVEFKGSLQAFKNVHADTLQTLEGEVTKDGKRR